MTTVSGTNSTTYKSAEAQNDSSTLSADFDQFLLLLTTQLQYQDPLNPMDSSEFTNQLVQYSQVEQQIKSNDYLETLNSYAANSEISTALGYVGLQISHEGDTFKYAGGEEGSISMAYSLPSDAAINTITILDSEGNTVITAEGKLAAGDYVFAWDGTDSDGNAVEAGVYTIEVNALTATGANITTTTRVPGYVEGIKTDEDDGSIKLIVNTTTVSLDDVTSARL